MKYVLAEYETGYHSDTETFVFEDEATDEEIENEVRYAAEEFYDDYDYLCTGWGQDFEDEEAREEYYDGCSYSWEYLTAAEYKESL